MAIERPNLIYVTVSFGSTALLEGLSRGIPCMIVREFPIEDYTGIDPKFIPVADVKAIVDQIAQCRDLGKLEALARRELAWYARETRFD